MQDQAWFHVLPLTKLVQSDYEQPGTGGRHSRLQDGRLQVVRRREATMKYRVRATRAVPHFKDRLTREGLVRHDTNSGATTWNIHSQVVSTTLVARLTFATGAGTGGGA